ncbi:hypothetical protein Q5Y75_07445 [Ruegeria sp. 2205SS24-7]|uniref:hypothetical protein n=1 Tax=Ruegeria discodermiae TaxID=3064389 RepID=UPI002740F76D|nr:hypothetical protein [Ruegeria sp. 2205SS24-7]MDP5217046.1 hypothetical protein [Ruegeria sp. 2205SS24-7]
MLITKPFVFALALTSMAASGHAAEFSDPTWPCVQRKVEQLSLGLMWPHPVDTTRIEGDDVLGLEVAELADALALRRVELEDLRPQVAAFADRHNGDPAVLGLVFDRVFNGLSKRRTRIISGIGEFSLSQIGLAEQIDKVRAEMDTAMAAESPDFDKVDKLEEQLDWDQLIYSDRQRSITYLCETPQIIERRLFAIAQMLQAAVQDQG